VMGGRDPGYGGLLTAQLTAIPDIPRLFGKGAVVRDLVLWSRTNGRFDPVGGLSQLALEAACLATAILVARRPRIGVETKIAAQ
jgi:hypothetical protein